MAYEFVEHKFEGEDGESNKYIFMTSNSCSKEEDVLAQVISIDIRGDYGFFINDQKESKEKFWVGNAFVIRTNEKDNSVNIVDLLSKEEQTYTVEYTDFINALIEWKSNYLERLGFEKFSSMALNHMLSVLLLANELLYPGARPGEVFVEEIKRSASRYGVSRATVYRDCRKVTGLSSIGLFYEWAYYLLKNKKMTIDPNDSVMGNIDSIAHIDAYVYNYLGVKFIR